MRLSFRGATRAIVAALVVGLFSLPVWAQKPAPSGQMAASVNGKPITRSQYDQQWYSSQLQTNRNPGQLGNLSQPFHRHSCFTTVPLLESTFEATRKNRQITYGLGNTKHETPPLSDEPTPVPRFGLLQESSSGTYHELP